VKCNHLLDSEIITITDHICSGKISLHHFKQLKPSISAMATWNDNAFGKAEFSAPIFSAT